MEIKENELMIGEERASGKQHANVFWSEMDSTKQHTVTVVDKVQDQLLKSGNIIAQTLIEKKVISVSNPAFWTNTLASGVINNYTYPYEPHQLSCFCHYILPLE